MSGLLHDLLNNAPAGVTVKDLGTNDRGDRVVQWWACDRFGISLRTGEGYLWAEGREIIKDRSSCGWNTIGNPRDLEGRERVVDFLRDVISEYRVNVQF